MSLQWALSIRNAIFISCGYFHLFYLTLITWNHRGYKIAFLPTYVVLQSSLSKSEVEGKWTDTKMEWHLILLHFLWAPLTSVCRIDIFFWSTDIREVFDLFDFWDGRDGMIDAVKVGDLLRCSGFNPTIALTVKHGATLKQGQLFLLLIWRQR